MEIDNKLNFSKHVHQLAKRAGGQLNFLIRNKKFSNYDAKKVVIESFILANFNYCPLVWHFCSSESIKKLERIQERAFRFLLGDYESTYDQILIKLNKPSLQIRRLRLLATEIFKTINNLNAPYMKEVFELNTRRAETGHNRLVVQSQFSMKYGSYSLRSLGPKIWNKLPSEMKNCDNLLIFKKMLTNWSGPHCQCGSCKYLGLCS